MFVMHRSVSSIVGWGMDSLSVARGHSLQRPAVRAQERDAERDPRGLEDEEADVMKRIRSHHEGDGQADRPDER